MRYIVGVDEVGRGCLAGPVVVAAVALRAGFRVSPIANRVGKKGQKIPLRDSKKLTPRQRQLWHAYLTKHSALRYGIARVYPRQIEKRNITRAANLAALRAYTRLARSAKLEARNCSVYLDGGLYLGNGPQSKNARTIVRGDEKFAAIKAASIIAKVSRDRFMRRLAITHPRYGFGAHKGYGTKMHLAALRRYGPTEAHRLTFLDFLQNSKVSRRNFVRKS